MSPSPKHQNQKPFKEHLFELRRRLLICVAIIAVAGFGGYFIHEKLLHIIQTPLGEKLYYTSPTGGFNFIFSLCLSFGILIALPIITYQLLAFLRPALHDKNHVKLFWYPLFSAILAAAGILFAYYISLPAALHFLTNFGGNGIEALITTDAYFRFALAYLVGFAVLFQLPLLLIAANRITPLPPKTLMKGQKYVIVGSFLVAAILTPTPDPFNQLLMAGPIILLYEFSVALIYFINLKRTSTSAPIQQSSVIKNPHKTTRHSTPKTVLEPLKIPQAGPLISDVIGAQVGTLRRVAPAHTKREAVIQPRGNFTRPINRSLAKWPNGTFIDVVNVTR